MEKAEILKEKFYSSTIFVINFEFNLDVNISIFA